MNSLKKGEGVPLLNFEGGPGVPLLNFEGGPGVPLLNFRGVPGLTFKLWGGSRVPGSWSHFYTMSSEGVLLSRVMARLKSWGWELINTINYAKSEHPYFLKFNRVVHLS